MMFYDQFHLQLQSPSEAQREIANRLKAIRLMAGMKQSVLAVRAGVSLASLRLFEQKGEISLKHLMRICHALGRLDDFEALFKLPPATTMAELEASATVRQRKRASR